MKRPYVIVNCAMSADGKIALPNGTQLRISCDEDIERMYRLRNESDAVLVGIGAVLSDNPRLTVKEKYVKNPHQPLRIVLDSKCRTPKDSLVVNQTAKTCVITAEKCDTKFEDNVEVIECAADEEGLIDLEELLDILCKRGIKTLMVEGGGTVIWSFLRSDLVDDLYIYIAPIIIGGKLTPTMTDGSGIKSEDELISLKIADIKKLGKGILVQYKRL
ncbi:MAG: 2,5-diamino-6-(ribosylamino)-4(3H)-pyrimidinone 5'-phosphate reductase [Thermoplasmatales archaeon]|nr:2,5-diamino-6-(ribosylamino)-4(3H)-pyrimidinone 5'-phosphate reductase [Thermoplasmatales archaeon]